MQKIRESPCRCQSVDKRYTRNFSGTQHVATLDMSQVQNESLQKLLEKGTKYRPRGMGGETETNHVAVHDLNRQLKRKYPRLGRNLQTLNWDSMVSGLVMVIEGG